MEATYGSAEKAPGSRCGSGQRPVCDERRACRSRHESACRDDVAYLRAGRSNLEIFEDYPTLPIDGIDADIRWAELNIGPDWKTSLEQKEYGR